MGRRVLVTIGTRPEAIKLAPVIRLARERGDFDVQTCVTGQHRELVAPVLAFFDITPDHDLAVARRDQRLAGLTAAVVSGMDELLMRVQPDIVVVQGDTTSAMAAALAAYYAKISVAHVEAGLRSGDLYSPFPEEANRSLIGRVARWHFAPTEQARLNLEREGLATDVHVVGNTGIDALLRTIDLVRDRTYADEFGFVDPKRRMLLVTVHRRESFGEPLREICRAIRDVADAHPDVQVVLPVHPNPNVRETVYEILQGHSAIHLIDPVDYPRMVWLLARSYLVLTDSGGIQEEAPSLGKPVLVARDVTERQEGVEAGCSIVVGTSRAAITTFASRLLNDAAEYAAMSRVENPYGDGQSSARILDIMSAAAVSPR